MLWTELLQSVFTSVKLAIYHLVEPLDLEAVRQVRKVDVSLDRLRGAMAKEGNTDAVAKLARDSYLRTLALAQLVKNTPIRTAVGRLVDLLTPYGTAPQKLAA